MLVFTRCLADLGIALDCPSKDPEFIREPDMAEIPTFLTPHQPYSQKIMEKFPSAPLALVDRLGKSNLRRHQRIVERHLEADCLQREEDVPLPGLPQSNQPSARDQHRVSGTWNWAMNAGWKDSALGTSIPTHADASQAGKSDMSSILSSLAEASWKAFPPLTEDAKHGKPFECEGCGRVIVMVKTRLWR